MQWKKNERSDCLIAYLSTRTGIPDHLTGLILELGKVAHSIYHRYIVSGDLKKGRRGGGDGEEEWGEEYRCEHWHPPNSSETKCPHEALRILNKTLLSTNITLDGRDPYAGLKLRRTSHVTFPHSWNSNAATHESRIQRPKAPQQS